MNHVLKKIVLYAIFPLVGLSIGGALGITIADALVTSVWDWSRVFQICFFLMTVTLCVHGIFTLIWMHYAWQDPEHAKRNASPETFTNPYHSFTALLPVRHEAAVVKDTIIAINKLHYPNYLKEIIVLCRYDDTETIRKVEETIEELENPNIHLEIFDGDIINKPHALNNGLAVSSNRIIAIFDAEDEPHPDIYNIINTILETEDVDIVQSGVQLMNYRSSWFSALNCLEYYFWFKSGLHFFSRIGQVTPLGGNTVFFKRHFLEKIGGWDETCLTEDADIGFRLIEAGAKVRVVYDEKHVTKEETPPTLSGFIKQRTRWNQGFLQVFFKYNWISLPKARQKLVSMYILLSPLMQAFLCLYIPFALFFAFTIKVPVLLALFSFVPLFLFFIQITTLAIGLYEFTKSYSLRFNPLMFFSILLFFYPYLVVLAYASIRGVYRYAVGLSTWEKTSHVNAHRDNLHLMYAKHL